MIHQRHRVHGSRTGKRPVAQSTRGRTAMSTRAATSAADPPRSSAPSPHRAELMCFVLCRARLL